MRNEYASAVTFLISGGDQAVQAYVYKMGRTDGFCTADCRH